jgi:hypothetical protein
MRSGNLPFTLSPHQVDHKNDNHYGEDNFPPTEYYPKSKATRNYRIGLQ